MNCAALQMLCLFCVCPVFECVRGLKLPGPLLAHCLQVQGQSGKHVNTVTGYDKLADKIQTLEGDVQQAKRAIGRSRTTVDSLLDDARVCLLPKHVHLQYRQSCCICILPFSHAEGCVVQRLTASIHVMSIHTVPCACRFPVSHSVLFGL